MRSTGPSSSESPTNSEEQMVQLGDHAQVRIIRMRKVPFIDLDGHP